MQQALERLVQCLRLIEWSQLGIVWAVLYGSLVRGDYIDGCSDVDLFLATLKPLEATALKHVESAALSCAERSGLQPRQIDIAWCTVDELQHGVCSFKFLTIYYEDFKRNSLTIHGEPISPKQRWSLRERCEKIINLLKAPGRIPLRIVAGEAVKLLLYLRGHRGPWDKYTVARIVEGEGDECMRAVWGSYMRCQQLEDSSQLLRSCTRHLEAGLRAACSSGNTGQV